MNFKIIFLSLLLVLGVKSKSFAQQDSVVIIGHFINDSNDLTKYSDHFLSLANLDFEVFYRDKYAHLTSAYSPLKIFRSDNFGRFEIKAHLSILNSNVIIKFQRGYFENLYFSVRPIDIINPISLTVKSNLKVVSGSVIACPRINVDNLNSSMNVYSTEQIEIRGIESILKDIH